MDTRFKITRHVAWSRYVTGVTVVVCLVLSAAAFRAETLHRPLIMFACIGIVIVTALYYSPTAVSVDKRYLTIRRLLTPKRIALDEIKEVSMFHAKRGLRLWGSGGFFGYYGWFCGRQTGRYFVYAGNWADTFMIELKSGKKYVIGCNQPEVMVKCIMDWK